MRRRLVLASGLGLALVGGAPAAHATASFQGLGNLPGATGSSATAVSADGSTVVGTSGVDAFRWTAAEGMTALERRPGLAFAIATDVSADGTVIVGNDFRWTAGAGMVSVGFGATAVSSDGTVVVGNGFPGVYRWTESDGAVAIPVQELSDRFSSTATDVSADGSVIVGYSFDGDETWRGFRWSVEDGTVRSGVPQIAYAVRSDGSTVLGQSKNFDGNFWGWWPREAVLQSEGTEPVRLGFLQPVPNEVDDIRWSVALGISDDGIVVGSSCGSVGGPAGPPPSGGAGCDAFLWDSLNGMRALQDALEDEHGLDLTGWTLMSAADISPDGRTIVGTGTNPAGATEAWIAFVPEPRTGVLLALGLAALAARERRQGRKVVASWRSSQ